MATEQQWDMVPSQKERRDRLLHGETILINRKKDKLLLSWAKQEKLTTDIGRKNRNDLGEWGNRHTLLKETDRDWICGLHELDLQEKIENDPQLLDRIQDLKGRALVCYCYPKRCHGNNLINRINTHD